MFYALLNFFYKFPCLFLRFIIFWCFPLTIIFPTRPIQTFTRPQHTILAIFTTSLKTLLLTSTLYRTTKIISSPFLPTLQRVFSPMLKRRSLKLRRDKLSQEKQKKSRIMNHKFLNVILEIQRIFPHSYDSNKNMEETSTPISFITCSESFWSSKILGKS